MLMTTTSVIEGKPVSKYLGIVTGEAIIGANIFRDMFATVRDVVGGRSATYEKGLAEARQAAMTEMQARAQELGANAIVGVDIDYEVMGQNNGMLMVPSAAPRSCAAGRWSQRGVQSVTPARPAVTVKTMDVSVM